jgi:fluoride exporter
MEIFTKFLAVGFGGAFGAIARYGFNLLFAKAFLPFPFATFLINILGSFLIGLLAYLFTEKFPEHENLRLILTVGFLGAFTTFSTFELETFELIREKQLTTAFLYVSASFAIGLLAVFCGIWTAKRFS